jgi:ABC-type transporter Mla MlaB component
MEWLSLSGDLTRDRAVEQVLAPSTSSDVDSELCLHLSHVDRLDVVTAAAVRLRMVRHEREHPEGTVNLVLPSEPGAAARLATLLDPLSSRIKLAGQVDADAPANYALVPATVVDDYARCSRARRLDAGCLRAGRDLRAAHCIHSRRCDGACR